MTNLFIIFLYHYFPRNKQITLNLIFHESITLEVKKVQNSLGERTHLVTLSLTLGNEQSEPQGPWSGGVPWPGRQISQLCLIMDMYVF